MKTLGRIVTGIILLMMAPVWAQEGDLLEELREEEATSTSLTAELERLTAAEMDKVDLIRKLERENRYDQLEAMARRDFISAMDKYSRAEDFWDKATRAEKRNENERAEAYRTQARGKYEDAIDELEFIDDWYPHFSRRNDVYFIWGDSLYKLDDYYDAIGILERLREKYPAYTKMGDALLQLGECHYSLEDYQDAAYFYQRVVDDFSHLRSAFKTSMKRLEWIYKYWAHSTFETASYAKALPIFQRLLEVYRSYTDVPEAIFYVGECHFYLGERENARKRYDTIKAKYTDSRYLGASLARLEELAQMYFDEGMDKYGDETDIAYFAAADIFGFIVERYPGYSRLDETLYRWGDSHFQVDDYQGAQKPLVRCKKDHPMSTWSMYSLYTLEYMRYKRERFNEAIRFYQELAGKTDFSSFEFNDASRYVAGMCYYRLAKYQKAVDVVQGIGRSGEYAIYGAYLGGLCLVKQDKLEAALDSFKDMAAAPTYSTATKRLIGRAHIILAYLYQRLGDNNAAWLEYEMISASDIENWDDAQVGKAYLMINRDDEGDYDDVIVMMRSLLNRCPNTELAPDAYILIGYCQIQEGEYEDAIDTLGDVVDSYTIDRERINSNPEFLKLIADIEEELKFVTSIITHEIKDIRNIGGDVLFPEELNEAEEEAREMQAAIAELQTFVSGRDIIGRDITEDAEFFRAYAAFTYKEDIKGRFQEVILEHADEYSELKEAREENLSCQEELREGAAGRTEVAGLEACQAEREENINWIVGEAWVEEFAYFKTTEEIEA
ncbi:tetratricopeptide repeat protein, partial [bacterium]|nr:tetratricopeptide repeat protein [bacterium]